MSVFGSAKTNFSNSEMSLGSSALMTAASTYTLSDCDYETSSELLSPRGTEANDDYNDDSRISPPSSHSSDIPDYNVLASRSSSILLNKATRESSVSIEANGYVLSVKSDTCLSQQSRVISDFVNEVLIEAQQSNTSPIQNEFYPTPQANDGSLIAASEIEPDQCRSSSNSVRRYCSRETLTHQESSTPDDDKIKVTEVTTTMSETKNKIIENLAQVTYDKLFSRLSGWRRSSNTDRNCQGEPVSNSSSQKSRFSRRSSRCNGVDSILRIDYELQPLNLRLSRLLAEFRAMDLRGKIGFIDPSFYRLSDEFHLPQDGNFKFTSTAVDNETRKTVESCEQFLRHEERVVASRSEKSYVRSSREGDRREPYSVEGCQLRLQSSEKSSLHCAHHYRSKRNVELCRKQSSHHQESVGECPSSGQKARTCCSYEDNDFGGCCRIEKNASCWPLGKKNENESSMSSAQYEYTGAAFSCRRLISPSRRGAFLTRPMEAGDSLSNGNDAGVTGGRSVMMIEMCDLRDARCTERMR